MAQLSQSQRTIRRYGKYAAIDRELRAHAAHMQSQTVGVNAPAYECYVEEGYDVVDDATYSEMGRKTIAAVSNLLDVLAGSRADAKWTVDANPGVMKALNETIVDLNSRVSSIEDNMRELSGFIARTDKILLTIYRQMDATDIADFRISSSDSAIKQLGTANKPVAAAPDKVPAKKSKTSAKSRNVPREEMQAMGRQVAAQLKKEGEPVTYSSVANRIGVPYYKVYYACRDDEEFVAMLDSASK